MNTLLSALTEALRGSAGWALAASLLWGAASVLLSPCHLASVPLVVAYTGRNSSSPRAASVLSVVFAAGILVMVMALGALATAIGHLLASLAHAATYVIAAVLLAVGAELMGLWSLPWPSMGGLAARRRGVGGAFLFGLAFGTALGPCTLAFLAPLLALVAGAATSRPVFAIGLAAAYAVGHCGVLAAIGSSGPFVGRVVTWSEGRLPVVRGGCGLIVIAAGLYLLYSA